MNFTFGITTDFGNYSQIDEVIKSIDDLKIPNYEVIIIGDTKKENAEKLKDRANLIYFDETIKPGWITKKKNMLVENAKYDNVVVFHDYFVFDKDWYKNYLTFGEDWDVCSNAQILINNKRHFTDWVCWDSPLFPRYTSLKYTDWSHTEHMYQSGGYFLVKKQFFSKYKLNEDMVWGTPEDVEWSLRMRNEANWKCNGDSIVKHNKVHRDAK